MVQRGVESLEFRRAAFGGHLRKHPVPRRPRVRLRLREVPAGDFRVEIPAGLSGRDRRQADLHGQRLAALHVEPEIAASRVASAAGGGQIGKAGPVPVEFKRECESPAFESASAVVGDLDVVHLIPARIADRPLVVEHYVRAASVEKSEAVYRAVRTYGNLHSRPGPAEVNRVIAGLHRFRTLVKIARKTVFARWAAIREEQEIAEVGASRAAEVRLREAFDFLLFEAVSRAMSPPVAAGVGSGLDQSERICRARKRMPVPARADFGSHP